MKDNTEGNPSFDVGVEVELKQGIALLSLNSIDNHNKHENANHESGDEGEGREY